MHQPSYGSTQVNTAYPHIKPLVPHICNPQALLTTSELASSASNSPLLIEAKSYMVHQRALYSSVMPRNPSQSSRSTMFGHKVFSCTRFVLLCSTPQIVFHVANCQGSLVSLTMTLFRIMKVCMDLQHCKQADVQVPQ